MSDLSIIEPDKGYYIYMTEDAILAASGGSITSDRQIALQPGWNLIGWTTIEQRLANDVLASVTADPEHLAWGLDEPDGADAWKFYASGEAGSDLVEFESGEGYWVHVSSAGNITVPAPAEQEYHYDSQGRRLGSVVIYDGENQIAKYDDSGALLVSYLQGPGIDNPISMTRDGQTYYYHTDALGSITELTDASGNVAQFYRYDAFGTIVQQSGNVQNPFTCTVREFDPETGLYYYRARYYDGETGRFLSRDPLEDKKIWNLFVYVMNNPIKLIDPLGLVPSPPSCGDPCYAQLHKHCLQCCLDECDNAAECANCQDHCPPIDLPL
jgi:RHS repeat-associated protein